MGWQRVLSCIVSASAFLSYSFEAHAQCGPTWGGCAPPVPEPLIYVSSVFFIPKIPFVSDGTGGRTKADCPELAKRLVAEPSDGTVTRAIAEFKAELDSKCGEKDRIDEFWFNDRLGNSCVLLEHHLFEGEPIEPAEEFCNKHIDRIKVINQSIVAVHFSGALPCEDHPIYSVICFSLLGAFARY